MKCKSCAGSGEDFNEGDPCCDCGGSGDADLPGPFAGKSLALEAANQYVAQKMKAFYEAFPLRCDK